MSFEETLSELWRHTFAENAKAVYNSKRGSFKFNWEDHRFWEPKLPKRVTGGSDSWGLIFLCVRRPCVRRRVRNGAKHWAGFGLVTEPFSSEDFRAHIGPEFLKDVV